MIDNQPKVRRRVLEYPQRSVILQHQYAGLIVIGHCGGDILDEDVVIAWIGTINRVRNQSAVTLQAVTDHGDGIPVITATDVECVTARSADHFNCHVLTGTGDEEGVVTFQGIDNDLLQTGVGDV